MAGDDDSAERNEEPTQRKLDQAREKGDIAKSPDISTAVSYLGLILIFVLGSGVIMDAAHRGMVLIDHAAEPMSFPGHMVIPVFFSLLGLLLIPGVVVLAALLGQRSIIFSSDKLQPKLSRISIISNAKQKFGIDGLNQFVKNFIKLIAISIALVVFLVKNIDLMMTTIALDPRQGMALLVSFLGQFLFVAAVITGLIGVGDLILQKFALIRRNMMSHQDIKDEHKESEGDPHTKALRRQRGQEIALNQMLQDVEKAAVVIVNPTHYATALKWERGTRSAPILVAKGVDQVALKIREKAIECGVPIHSDPPTARAIHASVKIGAPIERQHFEAVAAGIRFAETMRNRAKQR